MMIDAKGAILGRLSTFVAKQLLLGSKIDVVNCEEAVVSGKKQQILENYKRRLGRKAPGKGPYLYRRPDFFVKRTIRGMLPFKISRGKNAFMNVKCHIGIPDGLKNEKAMSLEADSSKLHSTDYLKVRDICKELGWK